MKRLLPLILIATVAATVGFAQSSKKAEKTARIYVASTSANTIDVYCERTEFSLANNSINYFCWDACYNPGTDVSDGTLAIAPNDTNTFFYAAYDANGDTGVSVLRYCFYVDGIMADSACLTVSYDENMPADSVYGVIAINSVVGIDFIGATNKNEILDIHPNPAKEAFALNYSLKRNVDYGQLVVRNMLGSHVYDVELKGTAGQVIVPVDKLNNGVYFCTMIVDNEVFQTKRLVVNH